MTKATYDRFRGLKSPAMPIRYPRLVLMRQQNQQGYMKVYKEKEANTALKLNYT